METIRNNWLRYFNSEMKTAKVVKIISPYITSGILKQILRSFKGESLEVITRFNLNDFFSGASSIIALKTLLANGAKIQGIQNLHSKVYIFDSSAAIITSANLTSMGFYNNYEFGVLTKGHTVLNCLEYFSSLQSNGGPYLTNEMIDKWERELESVPQKFKNVSLQLNDYGTDHDHSSRAVGRYFIKFLGSGNNRESPDCHVCEEIERAHCHFAVCFSSRPRQYRTGDVVYIARMITNNDYAIMGKAVAVSHKDDRDVASPADIAATLNSWKANYPYYIRVTNPVFVDTTLLNCPHMSNLIAEFGPQSFRTTWKRHLDGEKNINPRLSLVRQPGIEITEMSAKWLDDHLSHLVVEFGQVGTAFIDELYQGSDAPIL